MIKLSAVEELYNRRQLFANLSIGCVDEGIRLRVNGSTCYACMDDLPHLTIPLLTESLYDQEKAENDKQPHTIIISIIISMLQL